MNRGLELLEEGLPICNRLFREVHSVLLSSGRGEDKSPGRFRQEQNWIGGTDHRGLRVSSVRGGRAGAGALERFLHDRPERTPILIKAALAHAQFESIHPFLDGKGRVGRLLITLLLVADGVLKEPLLYLSLYLKQNRDNYYDHLQRIRTEGAWEAWLEFFLEGIVEVAESTTITTGDLVQMIERDRQKIHEFGRGAATAARLHDLISRFVIMRPTTAAKLLHLSAPPVYGAFNRLEEAGILREVSGRRRGKIYVYDEYLERLNEGTT